MSSTRRTTLRAATALGAVLTVILAGGAVTGIAHASESAPARDGVVVAAPTPTTTSTTTALPEAEDADDDGDGIDDAIDSDKDDDGVDRLRRRSTTTATA